MAALRPISRVDFIKRLKKDFDWAGPFQPAGRTGGKHPEFMTKDGRSPLNLPNVHRGEIGLDLLKPLLAQAGISRKEWLGETDNADDRDDPDEHPDGDQRPDTDELPKG